MAACAGTRAHAPLPAAEPPGGQGAPHVAPQPVMPPPVVELTQDERVMAPTYWIDRTLGGLTLREKVGQMVIPRISGAYLPENSPEYLRLQSWVRELGIGGVVLTQGPPLEIAQKLNLIQAMAKVPLLVTADMEHGPGQILQAGTILPYGLDNGSATRFPPLMGLGATGDGRLAYELGRITALEGRAAGVHVVFAPVVDVNNNSANPIINTRSYGEDPVVVSRMASAHIRGLQENGMLATAKHFPGHGDTGTDSHNTLPVITVARSRADVVELPPYRAAFAAGVAAVMSAHIAFPAITGDSVPATLNPRLLTGLLKQELGFQGIVFTDAMDMGAIMANYGNTRASVLAVLAGADALLQPLPQDVPAVIDAIVKAVESGEIPASRIDASVRKLLGLKTRAGLHYKRIADLDSIPRQVGTPANQRVAEEAAARSITLVRDRDHLLPLTRGQVVAIAYADDYDPFTGRLFHRMLTEKTPGLRTVVLDRRSTRAAIDSLFASIETDATVVFSAFIRVSAGKNDLAIAAPVADLANRLIARNRVIVTAFGNPYVLAQLPDAGTYLLAWGQWDVLQRAAARALTGDAAITGRLPISIPPYHRLGDGLTLPARGAR